MQHIERPHGNILEGKNKRFSNNPLFGEIINHYNEWVNETIKLNSEDNEDLKMKVKLLNQYKNYIDEITQKNFKLQDKISSSVIEEFLFFLFKDIPEVSTGLDNQLIF